jgi:solute carrier family 10 (sodium/bile acid cotransporter), member 7
MHWIRNNWFLILLMVVLLAGYYGCQWLSFLTGYRWLNWIIVACTMFVMAWPVEFGHFRRTLARPLAPLIASGLNIVVIPILLWPLALWVGGDLGMGMLIAGAAPSTLASAAVWSRRAGGDDSIPMVVTIITNGSCFLVMPMWIYLQSGQSVEREILTKTVLNLLFFVVLPILVAQTMRLNRASGLWASRHKPWLSILAMIGILAMVLIGAVSMGLRMSTQEVPPTWSHLFQVAALMGSVHIIVFWGGMGVAGLLGLPRMQIIAVGFAGSQKTLMTGLSVCISLGVSIVPIILYHSIQLIVDTLFADQLRRMGEQNRQAENRSEGDFEPFD